MHGPGTTVYYAKLLYVWMLVYDLPERLLVLLPAYALESRRGFCFKPLVPCILMAARLWSAHPWQFWPLLEWFFHFIDGRFFLSPFSLSFSLCKLCVEKNSRAIEKEEAVGKWQSSSALGSADPDCTQTHITWNERAKACAPPPYLSPPRWTVEAMSGNRNRKKSTQMQSTSCTLVYVYLPCIERQTIYHKGVLMNY